MQSDVKFIVKAGYIKFITKAIKHNSSVACSCSHRNIPPLFSVYARMEDLNEDSLYFFLKSGLLSRVNFTQKLNSAHAAESTEERQVYKDGVYFQCLLLY